MVEVLHAPRALVLAAPGINRDRATKIAYELAGAEADIIHVNQLKSRQVNMSRYQIISIPGGFSYGDHIQSGRILALEFQLPVLADQIYEHLRLGRIVLGVCNGFQVLVQAGFLPFRKVHREVHALNENITTLTDNVPQQFQSRWTHLKPCRSKCFFIPPSGSEPLTFPVAHGEGRFVAVDDRICQSLFEGSQVVYQYCTATGEVAMGYPHNPNGSAHSIAALCDDSGQIMGMMPHAEDYVRREHHPNWRRMDRTRVPDGLTFFRTIVSSAKDL